MQEAQSEIKSEGAPKVDETTIDDILKKPVEEKVMETLSQKNAVGKAKDYLSIMTFSKSGLVD